MPDNDERQQQILNAAAMVIVRLGYDKTTMSDIAAEAGVSRGTVYLYFKGKEELFEALVYSEWTQYAQSWLEHIEADPGGGTFGGFFRAVLHAVNSSPLIAALMRRDRRVMGNFLRKPDTLFAWMGTGSLTTNFIQALQTAGAIRKDVDPLVTAHIVEMLIYGHLTIGDIKSADQLPSYEVVLEALADMMDHALTPENGGNSEAGKAVMRQITAAARLQLEQRKQAKDESMTNHQGAAK